MTPEQWWGAALFMLVSSVTPGPNNTMLMASGVHFGFWRTLAHLMGVQLGFGFMVIAVGLGLHTVLAQFPAFYDLVRFAGAAYMGWMAWSLAKALPESSICVLALLLRSKEFTPVKPATIKIAMMVSAMDSSTMV